MSTRIRSSLVFIPLLVSSFGCNPDSPFAVLTDPPTCSILSIQKTDASWPYPATISMTVKNTGDATAYDISCSIKLKSGNTIVDKGVIFFGTLQSQESYKQEGSFYQITTHTDYSNAEYDLGWYDSQGNYHH